ncbi:hypothetical protein WR25_19474 [Diploscapter pachys]|uniref:Uncharacterized protein n=1 Tax=Diploscapter pachys TaxID=2018661 RepID=A0A2A2K0J3_9BILA|nr:hypothetical protein WR25_19474 [Diploscapter pachys]
MIIKWLRRVFRRKTRSDYYELRSEDIEVLKVTWDRAKKKNIGQHILRVLIERKPVFMDYYGIKVASQEELDSCKEFQLQSVFEIGGLAPASVTKVAWEKFMGFLEEALKNCEEEMPIGIFTFVAATISNIMLITGIYMKRYTFIIPYFTFCIPFIFLLVLGLFVNVMQKVNSKEITKKQSLVSNGALLSIIIFEVYTLIIVWKVFVYICDHNMDYNLRKSERVRTRVNWSYETQKDRVDAQRIVIGDKSDESCDEDEEEPPEHPHKKYSIVTAM